MLELSFILIPNVYSIASGLGLEIIDNVFPKEFWKR